MGNADGSQLGPWVMSVQFILTFYFLWKQKHGELGSRTTRVRKLLQSSKYNKVGIRNEKTTVDINKKDFLITFAFYSNWLCYIFELKGRIEIMFGV